MHASHVIPKLLDFQTANSRSLNVLELGLKVIFIECQRVELFYDVLNLRQTNQTGTADGTILFRLQSEHHKRYSNYISVGHLNLNKPWKEERGRNEEECIIYDEKSHRTGLQLPYLLLY